MLKYAASTRLNVSKITAANVNMKAKNDSVSKQNKLRISYLGIMFHRPMLCYAGRSKLPAFFSVCGKLQLHFISKSIWKCSISPWTCGHSKTTSEQMFTSQAKKESRRWWPILIGQTSSALIRHFKIIIKVMTGRGRTYLHHFRLFIIFSLSKFTSLLVLCSTRYIVLSTRDRK